MTVTLPEGYEAWTPATWETFTAGVVHHETWSPASKLEILHAIRRARGLTSWPTPSALGCAMFHDYQPAPHLNLIDQAFVDAREGKVDRILICTPPQIGKSSLAAEAAPLWWLHANPGHRVIVASYALDLAERRGRRVRNTISGRHGAALGLTLAGDSKSASRWDLTTGGGMLCVGMQGGISGNPANLAIIDDPHKDRAEANSATIRQNVWDTYTSAIETRMQPGGVICIILTRWHEDDLASRVLANEGTTEEGGLWRTIILPALAESDADPMGRKPGQPLTHPKMPGADDVALLEFWSRKRHAVGAREWPALYQQRPAPPEGAVWKWPWITANRRRPEQVGRLTKTIVAVDPSATGKDTSDAAGIVVCAKGHDGDGYVLDDRTLIATPLEWGKRACNAAIDWDAVEIVAEQNQGYEMIRLTINTAWAEVQKERADAKGRLCPRIVLVHSRAGKRIRAEPVAALYEAGRIHHVGDQLDALEEELTGWTGEGGSPNRLDAVTHGLTALLSKPSGPARSYSSSGKVLPGMAGGR